MVHVHAKVFAATPKTVARALLAVARVVVRWVIAGPSLHGP